MKSLELRSRFFSFFQQKGHFPVPSSSLIPADDPTLLFTNAGMNQFKDLFLGVEKRTYTRAVSIQKCIRAGGKHNDLENVGFTSRHLTFFEMMGNFSFGDYFKKEAIAYAWEFLTHTLNLDAGQLYVSVYEQDNEAYDIWRMQIGLPPEKIVRLGAKDNFWQMGETGPCGPCSEIYVDRGSTFGCGLATCAPGCACDRFLEIWNLVFMQFDRQKDGRAIPLAHTGVDTGMGLDRLCSVLQHTESVYETDLFQPILTQIESATGITYAHATAAHKAAFRVLADHIRSTSCALADGCLPAADGRGYVLRKIIRRAALFSQKLSDRTFFPQLVDGVIISLGSLYPDLVTQREHIIQILSQEIEQFSKNLIRGKALLEDKISQLAPDTSLLSGSVAFTLYDTYGFPLELTQIIAREQGLEVDTHQFEQAMQQQRSLSTSHESNYSLPLDPDIQTEFTGYQHLEERAKITHLVMQDQAVTHVPAQQRCWMITDRSPFYVAGGGQVSDTGTVTIAGQAVPVLEVLKQGNLRALLIDTPVTLSIGTEVHLYVSEESRRATMKNHTATHLLQAALMNIIGKGIKQAGSLVAPEYVRFDFSCETQLTAEHIDRIEQYVNRAIQHNIAVTTEITTLAQAQREGVIAFFGDKYNPAHVRAVRIGSLSAELCGGTHVQATGEIGIFKIIESTALAAGVRRIVALTGLSALRHIQKQMHTLKEASVQLKTNEQNIIPALEKLQAHLKTSNAMFKQYRKRLWTTQIPTWITQMEQTKNISFGIVLVEHAPHEELRELGQKLLHAQPGLWMLISTHAEHEEIQFVAMISPELQKQYPLKSLLQALQPLHMRGGGSDKAVQGGAPFLPEGLKQTLKEWIKL